MGILLPNKEIKFLINVLNDHLDCLRAKELKTLLANEYPDTCQYKMKQSIEDLLAKLKNMLKRKLKKKEEVR